MKKQIILVLAMASLIISTISGCGSKPSSDQPGTQETVTAENAAEDTSGPGPEDGNVSDSISSDGEKITIRYAADTIQDSAEGKEFFELLEQFKEDNPDIDLQFELAIDADMKTKIKTEAAADMLPDVFWYWSTFSNSQFLYESHLVVPLETICENSEVLSMDMYPEAVLSAISYEGVPMGIPGDASRGFFIVNKALYDEYNVPLPKTYEEFREGGKIFIENGIIPLATGFKDGNPGHHWFSILLNQLPGGTEEFNDMMLGKVHPESGNIAKVAQIIQEDADLGMYPKDFINGDWNTQQTLFFEGKAAAMYSLSFQLQNCPEDFAKNCQMWSVPKLDGAERDPFTFYTYGPQDSIMVSQKSFEDPVKREAIMRFIDFWFGQEHMNSMAKYRELALDYSVSTELPPLVMEMYDYQKGMDTVPSLFSAIPDATLFNDVKNALQETAAKITTPEQFSDKMAELFQEYNDQK